MGAGGAAWAKCCENGHLTAQYPEQETGRWHRCHPGQTQANQSPLFCNQLRWDTAALTGYVPPATAETQDGPTRPKALTIWPFTEKVC